MKKYIFLTLLFLVLLPNMVRAYCSDSDTVRLQNIANNVTVSYIYNDSTGRFTITFSNLRKDLILVDFLNNKKEEKKKKKSIFEYVLEFLIKYYRIIAYIVLPIILVILIVMIIRKRKKEDLF